MADKTPQDEKTPKLGIKKVTLQDLDEASLGKAAGGTNPGYTYTCTVDGGANCGDSSDKCNTDQLGSGGMTCSSTCWEPGGCSSLGTCAAYGCS
jgi:hypothetical protein